MTGGYIKIPRELFEGHEFGREKFSHREALIDLIQMAEIKPRDVLVSGIKVQVERGQIAASRGFLAARWGWDKGKVRRFLDELCKSGRCTQENGRITILTIIGYDSYDEGGPKTITPVEPPVKQKPEIKHVVPLADSVNRIYALYPSSAKRPEVNRAALMSAKKNKAHITRMLGSGEYTEESLTYAIKRYLDETKPEYLKMFETFLNQVPDYGANTEQSTQSEQTSYEDAIEKAKNPTKEEIKAWWDKRMAPFYPKNPDETNAQYRARVKPSYESELKSWIDDRVERVKQRYL